MRWSTMKPYLRAAFLSFALGLATAALAVPASPQAIREAAALIPADGNAARIVVLGELHGTHEAPALASELVRLRLQRGEPVTLGLEIHATEQPRIDAFMRSSGDEASREALLSGTYWNVPPERNDGRRSTAMLALLEAARVLQSEGAELRVLAFDVGRADGVAGTRNPQMAARLRAAFEAEPSRTFVVLIGNYHARRGPPSFVGGLPHGQTPPVPTMAHLADVPMLRVNVTAERGEFWGCMDGSCQARPAAGLRAASAPNAGLKTGAALQAERKPRFELTPGETAPWGAILVLPEYSVAVPAESLRSR